MEPAAALLLNLLARGAAVGMLLLVAGVLWRDHRALVAGRFGAAFALGLSASTLAPAPGLMASAGAWGVVLAALSTGSMFVFWLFTRALLDDAFRVRRWHAAMWVTLAALGAFHALAVLPHQLPGIEPFAPAFGAFMSLMPVAWALLAVAQSMSTWREDLVEPRRRIRSVIVLVTAVYTVAQLLVAVAAGTGVRVVVGSPANAAGLALLVGLIVWRLLRLGDIDPFVVTPAAETSAAPRATDATVSSATAATPAPLDPAHARQFATLEGLMTVQHLYREPNLTIGALALRMGLPEHRLRRLINQGLGHRHFSAFLNTYRVDDARRALRDPARAELPVLMIAMDVGFQSVGPFNRAFKAITGVTPTDYRRGAEPRPSVAQVEDLLHAETRLGLREDTADDSDADLGGAALAAARAGDKVG